MLGPFASGQEIDPKETTTLTAEKQGGSKPADEATDATAKADEERAAAVAADEPATPEIIDAIAIEVARNRLMRLGPPSFSSLGSAIGAAQ